MSSSAVRAGVQCLVCMVSLSAGEAPLSSSCMGQLQQSNRTVAVPHHLTCMVVLHAVTFRSSHLSCKPTTAYPEQAFSQQTSGMPDDAQVERLVPCPQGPYQAALAGLLTRDFMGQKGAAVTGVQNALMELRTICNQPLLSRLHVQVGGCRSPRSYTSVMSA